MAKKKESFEDALRKLEKIVARMEEADIPLEEALQNFEEGVRLARFCSKKLDEAEQKVAMLVRDETGALQPTPFVEEGDAD
jgi:exodeoxyribonuclease VII small subunit